MASSESKGQTIALVIVSTVMIALGVAAYMAYSDNDALRQKAVEADKQKREADKRTETAQKEYAEIRDLVLGATSQTTHDFVIGEMKKLLDNPDLSAQRRERRGRYETFDQALKYTQTELKNSDETVATLEETNNKLKDDIKKTEGVYAEKVKTAEEAQQAKETELTEAQAKFEVFRKEKDEELKKVTDQYAVLRDELVQAQRDREATVKTSTQKMSRLETLLEQRNRTEEVGKQQQYEHKDAGVVQVLSGGEYAKIDVGFEDGLKTGVTFGVYGKDVGGNPYELPKASIEVVSIDGPHYATGRIINEKLSSPVMTGDLLYNPIWDRGNRQGVAFIGLIYLDPTDKRPNDNDNEAFKRLVDASGGKVDAFVDLKTGNIVGQISPKTKWLVIGDIPEVTDETSDAKERQMVDSLNKMRPELVRQARENGTLVIPAQNFLTYLGHNMPSQTVPAGGEMNYLRGDQRPQPINPTTGKPAPRPDLRNRGGL